MRMPTCVAHLHDEALRIVRGRPQGGIEFEFRGINWPQRDDAFRFHEVRKIRFPWIENAADAFNEQLPAARMQRERRICRQVDIEADAT